MAKGANWLPEYTHPMQVVCMFLVSGSGHSTQHSTVEKINAALDRIAWLRDDWYKCWTEQAAAQTDMLTDEQRSTVSRINRNTTGSSTDSLLLHCLVRSK